MLRKNIGNIEKCLTVQCEVIIVTVFLYLLLYKSRDGGIENIKDDVSHKDCELNPPRPTRDAKILKTQSPNQ